METYSNSYGLLLVFLWPDMVCFGGARVFLPFSFFFSIKGIPLFMIGFT